MGEQKENSLQRLWTRLQQRDRWPRRWWYPPAPGTLTLQSGDLWRDLYKDTSDTIRRAMLALLAVSFYCLLVAFGTPDTELLVSTAPQTLPLIGARVSFGGILVAAPALLLAITGYLHLFRGYLLVLERQPIRPEVHTKTPTLFNLDHPLARILSHFIFYWLTPLSMTALALKARGRPDWVTLAIWSVALTTVWLLWLQIRRCPEKRRKWFSPAAFAAIGLLLAGAGLATYDAEVNGRDGWVWRPLGLERAHLNGANLRFAHLAGARLWRANLEGADLVSAYLEGAYLSGANLVGADLQLAHLEGASLSDANLEGANLGAAHLEGADLRRANLEGANLRSARLEGADLRSARNLKCEQLRQARNWQQALGDQVRACEAKN